jgi:hypothetical protein
MGMTLAFGVAILLCLSMVMATPASAHRRDYDCSDFAT